MSQERWSLPHGVCAVVEIGETDREATVVVRPRTGRRLWARNSHYWEECACADCTARRAGRMTREGTRI